MKQPELYERFLALHKREGGFIMPNPWDGTSALLLKLAGFEVGPEPNAIVALKMTDKETAVRFWNRLIDRGVYANLALPPATPGSLSLIRCSISAAHTEAQIDRALSAMVAVGRELGILVPDPRTSDQLAERLPA